MNDLTRVLLQLSGVQSKVTKNSGVEDWYTPPIFIEAARTVLGTIDLDPASSIKANTKIKATCIYTIQDDALTKSWEGRVWMNPPYSRCQQFVSKLLQHYRSSVSEAIVLVNNATETQWFQQLAKVSVAILFPSRRIRFYNSNWEESNNPLQGQAILYLGQKLEVFYQAFSKYGFILEMKH